MTQPVSLLPYLLAALIVLGDSPTYFRRRAGSHKRDGGSYWIIMLLASAGYWSAFVFAALSPRRVLPHGWMALAVALTVGGTAFRLWAVRTLGAYFTRTVQVSDDQRVVEAGPYRWLRHPSYTGSLVAAAGVGLALGNWGSLALIVVPLSASLLYRIKVEERALAASLGDPYRSYCGRTKRLVPLVY